MTAQSCPRCGSPSHEPYDSETLGLCPDSWHGPKAPTSSDSGHSLVVADEATELGDMLQWQARCVCGWQSEFGGEEWADQQAAWHSRQPSLAKSLPAGFAWCDSCAAARPAGHRCYRPGDVWRP